MTQTTPSFHTFKSNMNWQNLISSKRLGKEAEAKPLEERRTEFQRDYDRLIFSAAFRRMQNKTQVFPLPGVCTNGYVPYGWQFKNEDVYIPSEKAARLNIFGMITKRNQYKGFTTKESINADKIVDYLDRFSFNVTKKTVIVLDNASVHRNRKVKELRKIW